MSGSIWSDDNIRPGGRGESAKGLALFAISAQERLFVMRKPLKIGKRFLPLEERLMLVEAQVVRLLQMHEPDLSNHPGIEINPQLTLDSVKKEVHE